MLISLTTYTAIGHTGLMLELIGLFSAAFLAATLIPAQSEVVLVAMVGQAAHPVWLLLSVATFGNVLGSAANWVIGRFMIRYADHRWFPVPPKRLAQATNWYARFGHWSLLGAWLPFIGDPITLAAGLLREPFWRFALIVTVAKAGRYCILVWATLQLR